MHRMRSKAILRAVVVDTHEQRHSRRAAAARVRSGRQRQGNGALPGLVFFGNCCAMLPPNVPVGIWYIWLRRLTKLHTDDQMDQIPALHQIDQARI